MTSERQPTPGFAREIELLWGLKEAPRRAPRPKLSREAIVDTAIALADAEGLEGVSMQRVAKELGYTTMSLYRHVDSKEDLLALMSDAAVKGMPVPEPRTDGDWRAGVEEWCRSAITIYRAHPWAVHIPLSGPPGGPYGLRWMEAGLRELVASGLRADEAIQTLMLLAYTLRDALRIENDMRRVAAERGMSLEESTRMWAQSVRRVIDPREFPTISRVFEEGVFEEEPTETADPGPAEDIDFPIQRILDGIEAYVRDRKAGGDAP